MSKNMYRVSLFGVDEQGNKLTPQNCEEDFDMFVDNIEDPQFKVLINLDNYWVLVTKKGIYKLHKYLVSNYYFCTARGIKVTVIIKKMVAEVRYWN